MQRILLFFSVFLAPTLLLAQPFADQLNPESVLENVTSTTDIGDITASDQQFILQQARDFISALLADDKPALVQQLSALPLTPPERAIKVRGWTSANPALGAHDATQLYVYPQQNAVVLAAFEQEQHVPLIRFDSGGLQGLIFQRGPAGWQLRGIIE